MCANAWLKLVSAWSVLDAVAAVRERLTFVGLTVFRLQHHGTGFVRRDTVREGKVVVTGVVGRRVAFQHQVQHVLSKQRAVFVGRIVFQHMVTSSHVSQGHGDVLVGVVHVLLQIAFFRAVMIHHVGFKIHIAVRIHVESHGGIAVRNLAVLQIGNGDGFVHLRFLLFIRDGDRLQRAAFSYEHAIRAMYRADLTPFVFHAYAHIAVGAVDQLRHIEGPLVRIALSSGGNGHFSAH